MKIYKTVREAQNRLDEFMGETTNNHKGGHYTRHDGSRGPIARYYLGGNVPLSVVFAINRNPQSGKWRVTAAWLERYWRLVAPSDLWKAFAEWCEQEERRGQHHNRAAESEVE